jgi:hypothetical protein
VKKISGGLLSCLASLRLCSGFFAHDFAHMKILQKLHGGGIRRWAESPRVMLMEDIPSPNAGITFKESVMFIYGVRFLSFLLIITVSLRRKKNRAKHNYFLVFAV